jgi:hypothetical protein
MNFPKIGKKNEKKIIIRLHMKIKGLKVILKKNKVKKQFLCMKIDICEFGQIRIKVSSKIQNKRLI